MAELEQERLKKKSEKELLDDIFSNKTEETETSDFQDECGKWIEEETVADDVIVDFSEDSAENIPEKDMAERSWQKKENTAGKDKEKENREKAVVFIDFSEDADGKEIEKEKDSDILSDYEHTDCGVEVEDEEKNRDKKTPWWFYLLIALGIAAAVLLILLVI